MANGVKFSLKLLIDEKRNKVVLAEAEQDFVDVLLSLLTLPMGIIAGLLKDHNTILDCYRNLNKSVSEMDIRHFENDAFKSLLLSPKSSKDIHRKRLKLNMSYTSPTEFFVCPSFFKSASCGSRAYSNFRTICSCGALMDLQVLVPEEEQVEKVIGDVADGVFVNCRSSFIITDDLKVIPNSIGDLINVLKDLGYTGYNDLQETLIDVEFEEVVSLLGCLFTSEAPLTSVFLKKTCMTSMRMHEMLSPPKLKKGNANPGGACSVKVFVRKIDSKIIYAECNEDFIDSLLTFLVHPLEMACSLSNDNTIFGCVGNLCRSQCRGAASTSCNLPDFYICSTNNLLDYAHYYSLTYECWIPHKEYLSRKVARYIDRSLSKSGNIVSMYPKVNPGSSLSCGSGFMKRKTKFVVSDDLTITPTNSSSTIGLLRKMKVNINDLEEFQISISKAEVCFYY
ncbi:BnaA07g28700D [Brassica napus]|uniref:BnaA07g28700D protein n=2 Tax=Brassica napus TaxID=3708 RepID=A0A078HPR3_BRANA|nr:BnaA07g28700D [Brassica napus]